MSLLSRLLGKKADDDPVLVERAAPRPSAPPPRIVPPAPESERRTATAQPDTPGDRLTPSRQEIHPIPSHDRNRRLAEDGASRWFPAGHVCKVQGYSIPGGMIYSGESLPSIRDPRAPDPALINPRLAIDARHPDAAGATMDYWPSYHAISPAARAAYLDWLQSGRGPGAHIGYVFLFFYGLERRLLVDARSLPDAKAEVPGMLAEVERLLGLYGNSDSFRTYANNLLTVARVMHFGVDVRDIAPPMHSMGEMPLAAKIGLGALVAAGEPIPPVWAISWLRTHPESKLRTPATRCLKEFNELFRLRYQSAFGAGMVVDRNRAKLPIAYKPASASFSGEIRAEQVELPDVSKLVGPVRKLWEIAERATLELEEYSRWVGKTQERTSLSAISLLPSDLLPLVTTPVVRQFREYLQSALATERIAIVPLADLMRYWPEAGPKPDKKAFGQIARMLETGGIGIEPDPRYTPGFQADVDQVALFRQRSTQSTTSAEFASALSLLQMGVLVSSADGAISDAEEQSLRALVAHEPGLNEADRLRLHAYLHLARSRPPKLQHVKAKLEHVAPAQRELVRGHLVALVNADGQVSPGEIRLLERIYALLGFDAADIHGHVHTHASTNRPQSAPRSAAADGASPKGLFDPRLAAMISRETEALAHTLKDIFSEPDDEPEGSEADSPTPISEPATTTMSRLDQPHRAVLASIAAQELWTRSDLDSVIRSAGLSFVDSAVETINDAGFELGLDTVIEPDGDEFYVHQEAALRVLDER